MNNDKIFVLGLGAQKSGTTWLHSYLNSYDDADFGLIKEYHIWDKEVFPSYRVTEEDLLAARDKEKRILELRVRYALQHLEGGYEAYFSGLTVPGQVRLTGDISPGYSALPAATLSEIKTRILSRGFKIKVVFLMRDPVERIWSAARMGRRNRLRRGEETAPTLAEADEVVSDYKSRQYTLRSRYDVTIQAIEEIFDAEEVYYGFYETLFNEDQVRSLSNFLEVEPNFEHTSVRVNVSKKSTGLPEEVAREIAQHYKPVYDFCLKRFPETREIWPSVLYALP